MIAIQNNEGFFVSCTGPGALCLRGAHKSAPSASVCVKVVTAQTTRRGVGSRGLSLFFTGVFPPPLTSLFSSLTTTPSQHIKTGQSLALVEVADVTDRHPCCATCRSRTCAPRCCWSSPRCATCGAPPPCGASSGSTWCLRGTGTTRDCRCAHACPLLLPQYVALCLVSSLKNVECGRIGRHFNRPVTSQESLLLGLNTSPDIRWE